MSKIALRPLEGLKKKENKKYFFQFCTCQTIPDFGRFDPVTEVLRDDTMEYVSTLTTHGRVI
jgi:hypothetical protein